MSRLFYGEGRSGARVLHAVDEASGEEVGRVEIPAPTNTAPMTYMHNGKQYIVISVAGEGTAAEHMALPLAEEQGARNENYPWTPRRYGLRCRSM